MCGVAGLFVPGASSLKDTSIRVVAASMADAIVHRGPDDAGVWCGSGVALAHRRLSIVDLSPAGHQPMSSDCGRFVIVFNGEIYNHLDLRKKLEVGGKAHFWRGHSDTESLLAAISAWGLEVALEACVGMFALALWDSAKDMLYLARDRVGEKPLYYGWAGENFVFGSELKALRISPGFSEEIDRGALALYMRHNHVPAPYSIYRSVRKLQAGHSLAVSRASVSSHVWPEPQAYWTAAEVAKTGVQHPFLFSSDHDAANALESCLRRSVREQMVADVPLGAFLSGGVDSSVVVALMQVEAQAVDAPSVKTFTIGFQEQGFDEAPYAKAVARHLGTEHTELYVTSVEALGVIPRLPLLYDEPFADSSQIPTFLVAQMARPHVTVALSGDAGDELFAGYNRYFLAARLWRRLGRIPLPLRRALGSVIRFVPASHWNKLFSACAPLLSERYRMSLPGDKILKAAGLLSRKNGRDLYKGLVSYWEPSDLVLGAKECETALSGEWPYLPSLVDQMMLLDTISYLPDDILVKVDRAAMGVSLETRVPFLDHRVIDFAWHLPMHYKVRNGVGKWLLRQVLYRYVPSQLIDRPKMGFGVPIDAWLRGPLRDWAESLIDEARLRREGFFNPVPIRKAWMEHLSGQRNWQHQLWNVLMFQSWLEVNP